jgi:hypothetical protein
MVKLSKAQQKTITDAKEEINKARSYNTFEEYFINELAKGYNTSYNTPEKYKKQDIEGYNKLKKYWENKKQGIVLTQSKTETLKRLELLNLIEIINISITSGRIDTIKVLNY